MQNLEGESFGAYRLTCLLGRGGLADVYLGEQRGSRSKVALKILRFPLLPDGLETFLRTMQEYTRLLHPHLPRLLECFSQGHRPVIVMEYAPQGSLRQRYPRGTRLAPTTILPYVMQIAEALGHLHRQHLLHLDIKPENMLLRADGTLLLSDAGLFQALPESTRIQVAFDITGRARPLPPEQLQRAASAASDQYALGCVIYEWLSGKSPFSGTFAEIAAQQLFAPPAPLRTHASELSPVLEEVLAMAQARQVDKRFATIQAFANAFEQAVREEGKASGATSARTRSLPAETLVLSGERRAPTASPAKSEVVLPEQAAGAQEAVRRVAPTFCKGCGWPLPEQAGANCPTCAYPLEALQERRLLETAARDLQALVQAGGALLSVSGLARLSDTSIQALRRVAKYSHQPLPVIGLLQHYQRRLRELPSAPPSAQGSQPVPMLQESWARTETAGASVLPGALSASAAGPVARPLPGGRAPRPSPIAVLRPLIESPAGLMVALGTFLLLIAILVLPFAFPGSPLPLPVTLGAQIFFAFMAISMRRSARFREFAGIYASFFALTVPLLAIDVFQSSLTTNVPWLVALAALYATITYGAFAISQRFSPFGVLCATALVVAVLAFTQAISGSYLWTGTLLLLVGMLELAAVARRDGGPRGPLEQLFAGPWDVLRRPMAFSSLLIAGLVACVYGLVGVLLVLSNLLADAAGQEGLLFDLTTGVAWLITLLLLLLWLALFIRRAQNRLGACLVTPLLLLCVLFGCYVLLTGLSVSLLPSILFTAIPSESALSTRGFIYGLVLLGCAYFYYSAGRFVSDLYPRSGQYRDLLTVLLLCVLPLIVAPHVPEQVVQSVSSTRLLFAQPGFLLFLDALLLGAGGWLAILLARRRARQQDAARGSATPVSRWPWLLVLSGLLFTWAYGTFGLACAWLGVGSFWWFWGLTLLLLLDILLGQARFGRRWGIVLDILVISEALLTLLLGTQSQNNGLVPLALLGFGTLFYSILLYQKRSAWLFVPWLFVVVTLPDLLMNAYGMILLLGVLLPFASMGVRRAMPGPRRLSWAARLREGQLDTAWQWDWPLLTLALICGACILVHDFRQGAVISMPGLTFSLPTIGEFVSLAVVWYLAAGLARVRWWLVPVSIFALVTLLLLPPLSWGFWWLVGIVPSCTLLGFCIGRLGGRVWALPCYATALLAALLSGVDSFLPVTQVTRQFLPCFFFLYAIMTFLVLRLERASKDRWWISAALNVLTAGFGVWGLLLVIVVPTYELFGRRVSMDIVVAVAGGVAVLAGLLLVRRGLPASAFGGLSWIWPWYLIAAVAVLVVGSRAPQPARFYELSAFTLLATLVMLKERVPDALVLPFVLAFWAIVSAGWEFWQSMFASSVLCYLTFASHYVWRKIAPLRLWLPARAPALILALGGQTCITCALLIYYGGSGVTALELQAGAGSLVLLALLILWCAVSQSDRQARFGAGFLIGLLLALLLSWELRLVPNLIADVFFLPPASYLTVIAPFLLRDRSAPALQRIGWAAMIIGACGLFLPSLVLSNIGQGSVGDLSARLVSTLLLLGECLWLFGLGVVTRVRFFLLGGTALVVIAGIDALLYATSHIQQAGVMLVWLALAVSGVALIAGAAFLTVRRSKG